MAIPFKVTPAAAWRGDTRSCPARLRRECVVFRALCYSLVSIALGGCAQDTRDVELATQALDPGGSGQADTAGATSAMGSDEGEAANADAVCAAGETTAACTSGLDPAPGNMQPVTSVSGATGVACDGDGGSCAPPGDAGSACVPTGPRDCASALDNDCDGQPDNAIDDVCVCAPGSVEPCDEHPDLDGKGQCKPGSRTCVAGAGNTTSNWGACEGSVGPGTQDSCTVVGDDTNCDGINNGDCPCIEGESRACGPDAAVGICERGSQTCTNGTFGPCVGAVFAGRRDCSSNQDKDCDGRPDNTVDNACTCTIGAVQACGTHPGRDGNGQCKAGSQTCEAGATNQSSAFGACTGSVGPQALDTCDRGNDGNCNGVANQGCACVNGPVSRCGPPATVGVCKQGSQSCTNGSLGACQGAVFGGARSCTSPPGVDNDCDGKDDDTFDSTCPAPAGQACFGSDLRGAGAQCLDFLTGRGDLVDLAVIGTGGARFLQATVVGRNLSPRGLRISAAGFGPNGVVVPSCSISNVVVPPGGIATSGQFTLRNCDFPPFSTTIEATFVP